MSKTDLERVKEDLETMKHAIAPRLPFVRENVRFSLAAGVGGVLGLLWTLQPYQFPGLWGVIAFMFVLLLPLLVVGVHFAVSYEPGRLSASPAEIKRSNMNMHYVPWVVFLLAAPFLIWAKRAGLISPPFALAGFFFILGTAITAVALMGHKQRYLLGFSIPHMLVAIAIVTLSVRWMVLIAIMFVVMGLVTAVMMTVQLSRSTTSHGAH